MAGTNHFMIFSCLIGEEEEDGGGAGGMQAMIPLDPLTIKSHVNMHCAKSHYPPASHHAIHL